MAVTRIKNNQITDATVVANAKLVDYSISSAKLANDLVYNSNFTVGGNLTVQGNTTTIDTTITTIEDPVIVLASTQTSGVPTVDIGFLGYRGSSSNIAFVWDESADEFVTVFTSTGETNSTVTITSYANFHTNDANIGGNIVINGTTSLVGNIVGAVSFTGNVTAGNLLTPGQVSATGNVTGGNLRTAGLITATGNVTGGNLLTGGLISATSTITSAANITGGNLLTGGLVSATGNVTGGNITTAGLITATGTITSAANVVGGNITTAGLITATGNVTGGNILTGGIVSATGNVIADNVVTDNVVSTSALTLTTGSNGNINIQPNGTGNIVLSNTYINSVRYPVQDQDAASKLYVDNLVTTAVSYHEAVLAATTTTLAATTGGTITYNQPNGAGNGIGATLTTTGSFNLIDTANVQTANTRILVKNEANAAHNGVYVWSNATVITRSSDTNTYGAGNADALALNDYFFVSGGNVNLGSAWIVDAPTGTITFGTSNIVFAQFSQSQVYSANTSAGLSLTGTVFSAKTDNNTTAFDGGGNIIVKAGANLTTPNIGAATGTSLSLTGNVTGGNVNTAGLITATGNVTGGNLLTGGLISATSTITSAANITGANLITSGLVTATGNITGGNVLTGGLVTATGNITGGNIRTAGLITATGNITGGNLLTGGLISATSTITSAANVIGGNITTAGLITATGNVTGGNILTAGIMSSTGNGIHGNVLTGGLITATGNITGANLILTSGTIDGPAAGRITINGSDIDTDFAVDGDTLANIFYVDAGTGTASFGSSSQTTNALVSFNATTSIKTPVGNTLQRPAVGVTGMLRFNTTDNALEIYDNSQWTAVGVPAFTVIADQQFNGDGANTVFTLSTSQTTNSCIVSINGVVQIPTVAYSVSGTTLTFTEAPLSGDLIDVRQITTTTTVTSLLNSSGNAEFSASETSAAFNVKGNLIPVTDNTYTLGNASNRWANLYVAGNSIYLGNLILKENPANVFVVYLADGVTQANIDVGNVDVSAITSGTSTIGIYGTGQAYMSVNGNANVLLASNTSVAVNGLLSASGNVVGGNILTAGVITATGNITGNFFIGNGSQLTGIDATAIQNGTANVRTFLNGNVTTSAGGTANVLNVTSTGAIITGDLSVTGNATLSGNILGDRIQNGTTTIDIQTTNGNANVTVGGTSNVAVFATTGLFVTGLTSVSGNVTGGNITTAGLVTATGNVTGGNLLTGGLVSATSTITSAANITGGNLLTGGLVSATGNVSGGNLNVTGNIVDTGALSIITGSNGNIALAPNGTGIVTASGAFSAVGNVTGGNVLTGGLISATGAITGAALTGTSLTVSTGNVTCGNIVNANGNGVGNIGSSTTYFNTVFAKATSAQYADLAEKYTADADYEAGTVVMFGGAAEVTICGNDACRRVAGVVSTNPSYIMNGTLEATHVATVALTGRVPTKVTGIVRKGDLMVSAGNGSARAEVDPKVGTVIGKALADFDGTEGVIEVVVGRF